MSAAPETSRTAEEMRAYVLIKRGLYWRPNAMGYTGVLAEAGLYTEAEASARSRPGEDGVTMQLASEATEFAPACWQETKIAVLSQQVAQLQADLIAARKERDEALVRSTEDEIASSWDQAISDLTKGMLAKSEANLIALAKMYGEVCKQLHTYRYLLEGTIDEQGEGSPLAERLEAERDELADMLADTSQQKDAAEAEIAQLRSRLLEAEKGAEAMRKALKPFADVCGADHMRYVKDEQVLELSTRAEVPVSEKLRGRDFRAARLALQMLEGSDA